MRVTTQEKRKEGGFAETVRVIVHVSLTDDPPMAQAFVVIEARPIA